MRVHYAAGDLWVQAGKVAGLGKVVRGAGAAFEEHAYLGSDHLFADPDLPGYDLAPSETMWRRVLDFLNRVDAYSSLVKGWMSRG